MCCSSVISTHSVYHRTGFIFNDSCLFKWVGLSVACKLSVTEEQSTIRDQIRKIAKFFFLHNCETRQYSAKRQKTREFPHECVKGHNASDKNTGGREREREREEEEERERDEERSTPGCLRFQGGWGRWLPFFLCRPCALRLTLLSLSLSSPLLSFLFLSLSRRAILLLSPSSLVSARDSVS